MTTVYLSDELLEALGIDPNCDCQDEIEDILWSCVEDAEES